jgi:hypothetical protein
MAQLQADEEVDEAERKFDFRFEEPDQDYVSRNFQLFILTLCSKNVFESECKLISALKNQI